MSIQTIAIVHHVHTDFGYTDHPQRSKREHCRYIDLAEEYVLASSGYPEGSRFAWTQEQLYPVRQWWERASDARKERFFAAVDTGRLEITGTAFNTTAFLDRDEWRAMLRWIPEDLRERCRIRSAMQIDVNGMHTAGMIEAYDLGIRSLFIGPNTYYGAPPMPTPAAFLWQLDDARRMFVWLNASYNNGYFLFNRNWRQGPVPNYSDLRYRQPERGDIWASDDESVLASHRLCLEQLARIEGGAPTDEAAQADGPTKNRLYGGYALETLPVSVTSQWRFDNDPPFFPIVDFVRRWNELGLRPRLVLCTASQAMDMVKAEAGGSLPVLRGEWIDWWANGNASAPVEMSYSREAKRTLRAARSPLFGPMDASQEADAREILENLCLYDEHCFSSWQSVSDPYSFANRSQTAEKNAYVYRALDGAQCLLAERARARTEDLRNRIIVWNPSARPVTRYLELPRGCMRGDFGSVRCEETGAVWPAELTDGIVNFVRPKDPSEFGPENVSRTFSDRCAGQGVRFGPVTVPAMGTLHLVPETAPAGPADVSELGFTLETDGNGWPVLLSFEDRGAPALSGPFGEFLAVRADGFSPRWTLRDIFENESEEERKALRREHLREIPAQYGPAVRRRVPGLLSFEQPFTHDSVRYGVRILNADLLNGRVTLEVRIDRRSDFSPEVLFLRFRAPGEDALPDVSNAGVPFCPETGQLPGSCMDFYAIDGWLRYPNGWLLSCRDNALVTFGSTSVVARKTATEGPGTDLYVRLFDNVWDTNFNANACGMMRFRFTAAPDIPLDEAAEVSESMNSDPVVQVKTGYR